MIAADGVVKQVKRSLVADDGGGVSDREGLWFTHGVLNAHAACLLPRKGTYPGWRHTGSAVSGFGLAHNAGLGLAAVTESLPD